MIKIKQIIINQVITVDITVKDLKTLEKFRQGLELKAKMGNDDDEIVVRFIVQTDSLNTLYYKIKSRTL